MPILRTYTVKTTVEEQISVLICNKCGRTGKGKYENYDLHIIQLAGGYGDDFPADFQSVTFVTCGDCLKAWTDTFKHPVEIGGGYPNAVPFDALYTTVVEEFCWEHPAGMHVTIEAPTMRRPEDEYIHENPPDDAPDMAPGVYWCSDHPFQCLMTVWSPVGKQSVAVLRQLFSENQILAIPEPLWPAFFERTQP